jgi:hypothetical protein
MRIYASRCIAGSLVPQAPFEAARPPRSDSVALFAKRLAPHLKFDDKGLLLTEKIPPALLDTLNPGEIMAAQILLLRGRAVQIVSQPLNANTVKVMEQFIASVLGSHRKHPSPAWPWGSTPTTLVRHRPRTAGCEQLLAQIAADFAEATAAAAQVNTDIQTASNLLSQGQASTDPVTKLADANMGLAALADVWNQVTIANAALADATAVSAEMSNHSPACSQDTLNEMNAVLQQIAADDEAAQTWTGNWVGLIFFTGLFGSLQQLQQQAIAAVEALPPSCIQQSATWFGEIDIKLNEQCTQTLINLLKGGAGLGAILAGVGGALTGGVLAVIGTVYGGYAALIQADIGIADGVRHQGVTLHISPFASLFSPPGSELAVLATELIDPGFGGYSISPFWITAN